MRTERGDALEPFGKRKRSSDKIKTDENYHTFLVAYIRRVQVQRSHQVTLGAHKKKKKTTLLQCGGGDLKSEINQCLRSCWNVSIKQRRRPYTSRAKKEKQHCTYYTSSPAALFDVNWNAIGKGITKSIVDIYSNFYTDLVRSFLAWQPLRKHAREDKFASRHPTGWLSKREKDLYWTLYNTLHNWLQVYYMCCKLLPVCSFMSRRPVLSAGRRFETRNWKRHEQK